VPRRIELGPALAAVGAVLLLVALFLGWFGAASAWTVFELLDLVLAGIAVAALVAVAGVLDARLLPALGAVALVAVAAQLLEPPPGAGDEDRGTGAWLALAGSVLLLLGGILQSASITVSVQARGAGQTRRRVPAVDRRAADEAPGAGGDPRARDRPDPESTGRLPVVVLDRDDDEPADTEPTRVPAVDRRPEPGAASSSLFAPVTDDVERTQPLEPQERPDR